MRVVEHVGEGDERLGLLAGDDEPEDAADDAGASPDEVGVGEAPERGDGVADGAVVPLEGDPAGGNLLERGRAREQRHVIGREREGEGGERSGQAPEVGAEAGARPLALFEEAGREEGVVAGGLHAGGVERAADGGGARDLRGEQQTARDPEDDVALGDGGCGEDGAPGGQVGGDGERADGGAAAGEPGREHLHRDGFHPRAPPPG